MRTGKRTVLQSGVLVFGVIELLQQVALALLRLRLAVGQLARQLLLALLDALAHSRLHALLRLAQALAQLLHCDLCVGESAHCALWRFVGSCGLMV